jgi:type IV secretory pathway VirB4 component
MPTLDFSRIRTALKPRTPQLSDWVPWEDWLNEQTVLLSDGSACAWLEAEGRSAETANAHDINVWHNELNQVLRQAADDRLIYTTLLCHGVHDENILPSEATLIPFVGELQREYRANLLRQSLYFNKLYIVLQYTPASPGGEWIGDKIARAGERVSKPKQEDSAADRMRQVERISALLAEQLRECKVRRLGLAMRGPKPVNEIAEAQVFASTGLWREIGMTTGRMGSAMFSEDVTFHYEHAEIRHPGSTTYAAHLRFKEYPAATWPTQLNGLLAANFRFTLKQSFRLMEQAEGQKVIGRKQNFMAWANDKAASQREALSKAADKLQSGEFVMGEHDLTLCVFSERKGGGSTVYEKLLDAFRHAGLHAFAEGILDNVLGGPRSNGLSDVVNAAWRTFSSTGCVVARENRGLMAAWLSLMAGNQRYRVRPGAISSRNYAAFNPLHGFASGAPESRWGKPILVTRSMGGTPYAFHWHDGTNDAAVGNTLVTGETGSGKAQPLDAKVLTPTGWRLMGDLKVGDLVTCPDGGTAPIVGVYPQGDRAIYRITFEDGRTSECCDDHLWKVWHHKVVYETGKTHATRKPINGGAEWRVLPLSEVRRWFETGLRKAKRAAVPIVAPFAVELPPQDLPIPPYVLGAILGDGNFQKHGVRLSTAEPGHFLARIGAEMPEYELRRVKGSECDHRFALKEFHAHPTRRQAQKTVLGNGGAPLPWTAAAGHKADPALLTHGGETLTIRQWAERAGISSGGLRNRLLYWTVEEALGLVPPPTGKKVRSPLSAAIAGLGLAEKLAHEKFVPEIYKRGSVAQRLALLQGLMDTAGSVANGTHATFTSTSDRLARDVQELAWSLGAIAKINPRQTHHTYLGTKKPGRPSWRVSIVHPDVAQMFSLPRKIAASKPKGMRHRLGIVSIEAIGTKPAQCIAVDHPEHLYVTDDYVVTHNSASVGARLAFTAARIVPQGGSIIGLDHKRGWNALTLAMGGTYGALGGGEPHQSPMKALDDTARDREHIYDLLVGCVRQGGWRDLNGEEDRRLALGIAVVMQNPRKDRWIREVQAFLGDEEGGAGERLRRWCWGEDLGWVLDAPEDRIDLSDFMSVYDTTKLLSNKRARAPAMTDLFYRIERRLDGSPCLIPIDEGWYAMLEGEVFLPAIEKSSRTIRSKGGVLVFITQSPSDAVKSGIAAALVEQFPNQEHFANSRASRSDYVDGLKRTDGEFEALMSLQKSTGQFLLCKGKDSSIQQIPLAGLHDMLAVLSTNEHGITAIDAMDDETKDDPVRFLPEYLRLRREAASGALRRGRKAFNEERVA